MEAAEGVADVVREHRLRPAAVLVTHGHIDHMFSVAPVAGAYEAVAYVHTDDRHLLSDPFAGMSAESAQMLGGNHTFAEPDEVKELSDGALVQVAGLAFAVDHTPGHTWGSVTFRLPYDGPEDVSQVMFAGDLLFAGSIGRTDLPGGDHPTMLESLRNKVLTLDDDIVVLPGHGSQTSIGRERASNPYLLDLISQ
jgi:glyoxylase-like metal-dependent hydrolase (beta-lactamase superfamily II)